MGKSLPGSHWFFLCASVNVFRNINAILRLLWNRLVDSNSTTAEHSGDGEAHFSEVGWIHWVCRRLLSLLPKLLGKLGSWRNMPICTRNQSRHGQLATAVRSLDQRFIQQPLVGIRIRRWHIDPRGS